MSTAQTKTPVPFPNHVHAILHGAPGRSEFSAQITLVQPIAFPLGHREGALYMDELCSGTRSSEIQEAQTSRGRQPGRSSLATPSSICHILLLSINGEASLLRREGPQEGPLDP